MSSQKLEPPVRAELPDWILALKPPEADTAELESAVFTGLDSELAELMRVNPDELAWLADVAEQAVQRISSDEAAAILEGTRKPTRIRVRRRRYRRQRTALILLNVILFLMVLAVLAALSVLLYAPHLLSGWLF